MTPRTIALLGSTGSIGQAVLDVARQHPGEIRVSVLAAHSNIDLLAKQVAEFKPEHVGIADESKASELRERITSSNATLAVGETDIAALAKLDAVDIVVNAIVGAAGLHVSLTAAKAGKQLALANKESLVAGGPLFPPLLKKYGGTILPIDSEHSAIWQCLTSGKPDEIKRIILTASGGPFRALPREQFETITIEMALNHPTWKMGKKITIDSATLVNKGLEVIEACMLFSLPPEKISVLIHPQSIIHSMVEFVDSSMIAQLSSPDMRLPIQYALFWPQRKRSDYGQLDLETLRSLTFGQPDYEKFPALALAFEAARSGGTAPAVYNAANEVAVAAFLEGAISFTRIADIVKMAVDEVPLVSEPSLNDILDADRQARQIAQQKTGVQIAC